MTNPLANVGVDSALSERRTAVDHVAEALRDAILNGSFDDGAELNQVELAEHFGVSRVPVREALRRLEAEGLLRAEPHRPVVVIGLTAQRVAEIFDLRELLEGHLLERAAAALAPADVRALRDLCDHMDGVDDHQAWVEANRTFHQRLYAPAHAEITQGVVDQLNARVERFLHVLGGVERTKAAGREHRRILAALRRGDASGARELLEAHIRGTRDRVLARFDPSA